jgi:hypothetical protein
MLAASLGASPQADAGGAAALPDSPIVQEAIEAVARAKDPKAIRAVDLTTLLASPLGFASTAEATYADLTGDGKEELILPLATGGSAGDRGVMVFGYDSQGVLRPLLVRMSDVGHLQAKVDGDVLVISEPKYAPGEPNCCPGTMTFTTYAWNGHEMAVKDHRTQKMKH